MEQEQLQQHNVQEQDASDNGIFLTDWFLLLFHKTFAWIIDFQTQIQQLEMEKKKMREEFDSQRAKMKELFLQKEGSYKNRHNL